MQRLNFQVRRRGACRARARHVLALARCSGATSYLITELTPTALLPGQARWMRIAAEVPQESAAAMEKARAKGWMADVQGTDVASDWPVAWMRKVVVHTLESSLVSSSG